MFTLSWKHDVGCLNDHDYNTLIVSLNILPTNMAAIFRLITSSENISHSNFTCLWSGRRGNAQTESVTAALGSVPPLFSANQRLSFQSGGLMSFNVSRCCWFCVCVCVCVCLCWSFISPVMRLFRGAAITVDYSSTCCCKVTALNKVPGRILH